MMIIFISALAQSFYCDIYDLNLCHCTQYAFYMFIVCFIFLFLTADVVL